jgi:hypothetical protein
MIMKVPMDMATTCPVLNFTAVVCLVESAEDISKWLMRVIFFEHGYEHLRVSIGPGEREVEETITVDAAEGVGEEKLEDDVRIDRASVAVSKFNSVHDQVQELLSEEGRKSGRDVGRVEDGSCVGSGVQLEGVHQRKEDVDDSEVESVSIVH